MENKRFKLAQNDVQGKHRGRTTGEQKSIQITSSPPSEAWRMHRSGSTHFGENRTISEQEKNPECSLQVVLTVSSVTDQFLALFLIYVFGKLQSSPATKIIAHDGAGRSAGWEEGMKKGKITILFST